MDSENKNIKIAKRISLPDYLRVFNFISKVAYYVTNGNNNPMGPLRKECCTNLINTDINLVKLKSTITGDYTLKYLEMYTDRINEQYALSIVLVTTEPEEMPKPIQPLIYSNEVIFDDDLKRIYALIDYRLFTSNPNTSCADYIESVLNPVISEITDMELVQNEMTEYMIRNNNLPNKIERLPMRSLNILLANYLYEDGTKYKDDEAFMNTINITIDKLNGKAIDPGTEYMSLNIGCKEDIREIFTDFLNL